MKYSIGLFILMYILLSCAQSTEIDYCSSMRDSRFFIRFEGIRGKDLHNKVKDVEDFTQSEINAICSLLNSMQPRTLSDARLFDWRIWIAFDDQKTEDVAIHYKADHELKYIIRVGNKYYQSTKLGVLIESIIDLEEIKINESYRISD